MEDSGGLPSDFTSINSLNFSHFHVCSDYKRKSSLMMEAATTPLRPTVFADVPGLVAGFSTRHGGASAAPYASLNLGLSTGDEDARVQQNRRRLFAPLGFPPERLAIAGQVHGEKIKTVTEAGLFPGYDGLVTQKRGLLLCISAADCAAVLLADIEAGAIGACHAGWRGTVAGIVGKTVAALEALGAEAARLRAYVSPCISAEHFEVGPEVAAQFDAAFVRRWPGKAKPHVDLKATLAAQLEAAGVPAAGIEVSPHCTFAETDRFFSYRAENGETGRLMGFIGMPA